MERIDVPLEILIFDDASDSYTEENRNSAIAEGVSYRRFDNNLGRSAIRQKLAESARFQMLLFLDADVMPTGSDFLENYVKAAREDAEVVCGGIAYEADPPSKDKMLRYTYGVKREAKPASERNKEPYIIVTANMLIQKDMFLSINEDLSNFYGEDLLLSSNLKKNATAVLHIDNPVYHLGLEPTEDYLAKARSAVQNLVRLEGEKRIGDDFISLQRAYLKLKRFGLAPLFRWFMKLFDGSIQSNLLSARPSVFYFNLWRLSYYSELKKHG